MHSAFVNDTFKAGRVFTDGVSLWTHLDTMRVPTENTKHVEFGVSSMSLEATAVWSRILEGLSFLRGGLTRQK